MSVVLGGNKLWLYSASCSLLKATCCQEWSSASSCRQQGDQGNVLGEIRMHRLCLFSSHKLWSRQLQVLSFMVFFFSQRPFCLIWCWKSATQLWTLKHRNEKSVGNSFVSLAYAWHFHTDKVELNIGFLVKFGLGVRSLSIDCEPLSFFSFRQWVLLQKQEGQRGKLLPEVLSLIT